MEFNIDFENNSDAENKKISKIFSKQVFQNTYLLDQYDDYESYIVECIKNTFHVRSSIYLFNASISNFPCRSFFVRENIAYSVICDFLYFLLHKLKR